MTAKSPIARASYFSLVRKLRWRLLKIGAIMYVTAVGLPMARTGFLPLSALAFMLLGVVAMLALIMIAPWYLDGRDARAAQCLLDIRNAIGARIAEVEAGLSEFRRDMQGVDPAVVAMIAEQLHLLGSLYDTRIAQLARAAPYELRRAGIPALALAHDRAAARSTYAALVKLIDDQVARSREARKQGDHSLDAATAPCVELGLGLRNRLRELGVLDPDWVERLLQWRQLHVVRN